jgi:hypothetical protein
MECTIHSAFYKEVKILDHEGQEIQSLEELVDKYYSNPEDYFHTNRNSDADIVDDDDGNDNNDDDEEDKKNSLSKSAPQTVHPQDSKIASESQQTSITDIENTQNSSEESKKLHDDKNILQSGISSVPDSAAVEELFKDDPSASWNPLPEHDLKDSPCYPIIGTHSKYKMLFYYCKIHPDKQNVHLEIIEHHCKYKEPDIHKSEILRLLSTKEREEEG